MEKTLREAAAERLKSGHNDTCQSVLESDTKWPCNCGHDALRAALENTQGEDREADQPDAGTPVDFDMDEWHWLRESVEAEKLRIQKVLGGGIIGDDFEWYCSLEKKAVRVEQELDDAYDLWLKSRERGA